MKTEYQWLREARKINPEDAAEAIEDRWQELRKIRDVEYFDNPEVNEKFHDYLQFRRSEMNLKTTKTLINGRVKELIKFSDEDIIEILEDQMKTGYHRLVIPRHIKPKPNEATKIRQLSQDVDTINGLFND